MIILSMLTHPTITHPTITHLMITLDTITHLTITHHMITLDRITPSMITSSTTTQNMITHHTINSSTTTHNIITNLKGHMTITTMGLTIINATMMMMNKMSMKIMPMVNINMALHTVSFKLLKDPQFRKEAGSINIILASMKILKMFHLLINMRIQRLRSTKKSLKVFLCTLQCLPVSELWNA